MQIYKALKNQQ